MEVAELAREVSRKATPELMAELTRLRGDVVRSRQLIDDLRAEYREQLQSLMYVEAELMRRSRRDRRLNGSMVFDVG
jgi:hypothetical protein